MKKALLIGINNYTQYPLRGCVNDVASMTSFLHTQNFDCIESLLNEHATYANIITALKKLITEAKSGDIIFFHYSGHGAQIPDHNGSPDEADGFDECICPADVNFSMGRYITDDQLRALFSKVAKGVNIEVVMDCCHSGTGLRDVNTTARFMPIPVEYIKRAKTITVVPSTDNIILWAACLSNETAADVLINAQFRGAFTFSLLRSMQQSGLKRVVIERNLQADIKANGWRQTPQLECAAAHYNKTFLNFGDQT